jgi:hypothetical protein
MSSGVSNGGDRTPAQASFILEGWLSPSLTGRPWPRLLPSNRQGTCATNCTSRTRLPLSAPRNSTRWVFVRFRIKPPPGAQARSLSQTPRRVALVLSPLACTFSRSSPPRAPCPYPGGAAATPASPPGSFSQVAISCRCLYSQRADAGRKDSLILEECLPGLCGVFGRRSSVSRPEESRRDQANGGAKRPRRRAERSLDIKPRRFGSPAAKA